MSLFFVTTLAGGPAMREALGRAYASTNEQPYPIPSYFPNGTLDLNPENWTYWYSDPRLSRDNLHYAFSYSAGDFPGGLSAGQNIPTGYGDVTLPEPVELDAEWFPVVVDPMG